MLSFGTSPPPQNEGKAREDIHFRVRSRRFPPGRVSRGTRRRAPECITRILYELINAPTWPRAVSGEWFLAKIDMARGDVFRLIDAYQTPVAPYAD